LPLKKNSSLLLFFFGGGLENRIYYQNIEFLLHSYAVWIVCKYSSINIVLSLALVLEVVELAVLTVVVVVASLIACAIPAWSLSLGVDQTVK
jgi:hypothetical protein